VSSSGSTTTRRRKFSVDALFTDTSPRSVGVSDLLEARLIRLDRIVPDPEQPRREFDPAALTELAASIRAEGILQPIAVRYDEPRDIYVIVHGERRWRASKAAGLEQVPAVVRDVPEDRRLLQQLMENIVREDLNALDRATALRALKTRMGDASWDRVAEAVGIRRSRLFQLLGTEKLAPPVQEALRRGVVSEKQTRSVQTLPNEEQSDLGEQLLDGSLHSRDLEAAVYDLRRRVAVGSTRARGRQIGPVITRARRHVQALNAALDDIDELAALSDTSATPLAAELVQLQTRIADILAASITGA
jgi:ParB family chromosome partitioning protein